MKIGVDLDGVVIEFVRGYLKLYNQQYHRNLRFENIFSYDLWKPLGITKEQSIRLADEFYDSREFDNIELVEGAKEGLSRLVQDNDVFIITARPLHIKAKTEFFLRQHFPEAQLSVVYSGDFFNGQGRTKAEICEGLKANLILEDNIKYALECAERSMGVLLFDKPWNRNGKRYENMVRVRNWREVLEKINKES